MSSIVNMDQYLAEGPEDELEEMKAEPIVKYGGFLAGGWWGTYELVGYLLRFIYALIIGSEIDGAFASIRDVGYSAFQEDITIWVVHVVFLVIFLVDLVIRAYHCGVMKSLTNFWNKYELFVTLTTGLYLFVYQTMSSFYEDGSTLFHLFAVLPILRIGRAHNGVVLFNKRSLQAGNASIFTSLLLIMNGLANAFRTLLWVSLTIFLMCYVCAIFLVLQVGHNDDEFNPYFSRTGWDHEKYFKNVPTAMFTLMQVLTKDFWAEEVVRHCMMVGWHYAFFFPLFMMMTTYGLCYMVVGIIVDSILQVQKDNLEFQHRKNKMNEKRILASLRDSFAKLDEDGSGSLDLGELKQAAENPEIRARLIAINFPIDDPDNFFTMVDSDGSGDIGLDEFIVSCIRLTGPCRARDMLEAEKAVEILGSRIAAAEDRLLISSEKIRLLDQRTQTIVKQAPQVLGNLRKRRALMGLGKKFTGVHDDGTGGKSK